MTTPRVILSREKAEQAAMLGMKIWSGGGMIKDGKQYSAWACGKSNADMVEMVKQAGFPLFTMGQFKSHGAVGLWGISMDNVTPERGVWLRELHTSGTPQKVI